MSEVAFWVAIIILSVLFIGDPDLHDVLLEKLSDCETVVDSPPKD